MNKATWISNLGQSIAISVVGLGYIITNFNCNNSELPLVTMVTGIGLWWLGFLIGYGYEKGNKDEQS